MSGFSDYTTLLPRKEDGSGGAQEVGPYPTQGTFLLLLTYIIMGPKLWFKNNKYYKITKWR